MRSEASSGGGVAAQLTRRHACQDERWRERRETSTEAILTACEQEEVFNLGDWKPSISSVAGRM